MGLFWSILKRFESFWLVLNQFGPFFYGFEVVLK